MEPQGSLPCSQEPANSVLPHNGEELLAPCSTSKLQDHPSSEARDFLSVSGGHLLHPEPEDASCRGDWDPQEMCPNIYKK
jgi:hypothetical protein